CARPVARPGLVARLALPPRPTLFPYTTLFRSREDHRWGRWAAQDGLMTLTAQSESLARGSGQLAVDLDSVVKRFGPVTAVDGIRSEEHTSELQSRFELVCRPRLEKKKRTPPHR